MVPYCEMNDDAVFKALADASRRKLLDRLRQKNGQTLGELCSRLDMTRQAVAKHLRVLKKGNLVSWRREGRERLHFINPVVVRMNVTYTKNAYRIGMENGSGVATQTR